MTEAVAVDLKQLEQWRIILAQFPRTYEETSARVRVQFSTLILEGVAMALRWVLRDTLKRVLIH